MSPFAPRRAAAARRPLRPLAVVAGAVALAMGLAACAPAGSTQSDGAEEVPVVWSSVAIATNLDPAIGLDANNLAFYRNVYEGLLEYVPGGTEVRPALAESYEVSEDGLTYTFALREGVTFHDGTAFDADAVVANFDRMAEIGQGPAKYLTRMESWSAVDASTFELTLAEPYSYLPGTLPWLPIVSPTAIEEHATDDDPTAQTWLSTNEAGTGPYVLEAFEANNRIDLSAYEDYWQEWADGTPTSVTMTQVADSSTRLQLLQQGEITFSGGGYSPADFTTAQGFDGVEMIVQPGLAERTMVLNTTAPGPMEDPDFRRAVILSFPYDDYTAYFEGWGDAANGPIPPGMTGYDESRPDFEQDLDEARALFEAGGYIDSGVTIDMVSVEGATYGQYGATLLQGALAEFGITLNAQVLPWPQIPPLMADPSTAFDISFLNISANTADPTDIINTSFGSANTAALGGYNWSNIEDPEIDAMIAEARASQDPAEVDAIVQDLIDTVLDYDSVIYAIAPQLVQPVADGWGGALYDPIYNLIVVRFFYAASAE